MIINLTRKFATDAQLAAGVIDFKGDELEQLHELLDLPESAAPEIVEDRAHDIAQLIYFNGLAEDDEMAFTDAMIGGAAPTLLSVLEQTLQGMGLNVVYASELGS